MSEKTQTSGSIQNTSGAHLVTSQKSANNVNLAGALAFPLTSAPSIGNANLSEALAAAPVAPSAPAPSASAAQPSAVAKDK